MNDADNPYRLLLKNAFNALPEGVRLAHRVPLEARGLFDVHRGRSLLARTLADRMELPEEGRHVPVVLSIMVEGDHLRWMRRIGKRTFETTQRASADCLLERSRAFELAFRLIPGGDTLRYEQVAFRWRGIRLPLSLLPRVEAIVRDVPGGWIVQVDVRLPLLGSVCRYGGRMEPI